MEPASVAAGLATAKLAADVCGGALSLLRTIRESLETATEIDEQLLRVALIEVQQNLVLLDGMKTKGLRGRDRLLLPFFDQLRLDGLGALLLHWPHPGPEPAPPRFSSEPQTQRWMEQVAERQDDLQLLSYVRFIVVRAGGVRSLAAIDPEVTKQLSIGVRLRNLAQAHRQVLRLLESEQAIEHLVQRRSPGGPARVSVSVAKP